VDTIRWFQDHAKTLKKSYPNDASIQGRIAAVLHDDRALSLQRVQHVVAVEAGFQHWKALRDADDLERHLAIVMAQEPLLNDFGIGLYAGYNRSPREERLRILKQDRNLLRSSVDDVRRLVEWLKCHITPIKTINRRWSSYGLKSFAEEDMKHYFSNGMFIAAALIAGYTHQIDETPNVYFGMSQKSIKRFEK
jgi:hypothetical protein